MSDIEEIHGISQNPEDEIIPYVGPPVLLPIPIQQQEPKEIQLISLVSKMYRYHEGEWKQRGKGLVKFLEHKQTHQIRLVMIEDKTFHTRANHIVTQINGECDQ